MEYIAKKSGWPTPPPLPFESGGISYSQRRGEWSMNIGKELFRCDGSHGTPRFTVNTPDDQKWDDPRILVDMLRFRQEDNLWFKTRVQTIHADFVSKLKESGRFYDLPWFETDPFEDAAWVDIIME